LDYNQDIVSSTPSQVVTNSMGDILQTNKPSQYITNVNVNSAFYPSGWVNRVLASLAGFRVGHVHLCQVAGKSV